jgi:hypothetical protein
MIADGNRPTELLRNSLAARDISPEANQYAGTPGFENVCCHAQGCKMATSGRTFGGFMLRRNIGSRFPAAPIDAFKAPL